MENKKLFKNRFKNKNKPLSYNTFYIKQGGSSKEVYLKPSFDQKASTSRIQKVNRLALPVKSHISKINSKSFRNLQKQRSFVNPTTSYIKKYSKEEQSSFLKREKKKTLNNRLKPEIHTSRAIQSSNIQPQNKYLSVYSLSKPYFFEEGRKNVSKRPKLNSDNSRSFHNKSSKPALNIHPRPQMRGNTSSRASSTHRIQVIGNYDQRQPFLSKKPYMHKREGYKSHRRVESTGFSSKQKNTEIEQKILRFRDIK